MLKKNTFILIALLTCFSAFQFSVIAQQTTVKATIQPADIAIGQQSIINLEIVTNKGQNVVFPVYNDTIVSGVEVLSMPKADTIYTNDVMTINQKYIITSFDSASYKIPYMPIFDGRDTLKSNNLKLNVVPPVLSETTKSYLEQLKNNPNDSIDVSKLGTFDIKNIQEVPFVWQDYILYALATLAFILAIVGIIIGIYLYKKKKASGYFFKPKVIQPPHVIALDALSHIKEEKLWQQGREKEYFTDLTDVLRNYISKRFHINAFEMTSDEILSFVNNYTEMESSNESLKQVLKLADLVKFAKYKPYPNENDLSMANSILFVNQTKKEESKIEDPSNTKISDSENIDFSDADESPIDWTINHNEDDKINTNNKTEN